MRTIHSISPLPPVSRRAPRAWPAFLALLSVAAVMPAPDAWAQVHIGAGVGGSSTFEQLTVGTVTGGERHIVIPITIPAGSSPVPIWRVEFFIRSVDSISPSGNDLVVAVYNGQDNDSTDSDDQKYAPNIPDGITYSGSTASGYRFRFNNPSEFETPGHNYFTAPEGTTLPAGATYHLFIGVSDGSMVFDSLNGGDNMRVRECDASTGRTESRRNDQAAWTVGYVQSNLDAGDFDGSSDSYSSHQGDTLFFVLEGTANSAGDGLAITGGFGTGQELRVDFSGLMDANGLAGTGTNAERIALLRSRIPMASADVRLQWWEQNGDGSGFPSNKQAAFGSETYTLVESDLDKRIGVRLDYLDGHCHNDTVRIFRTNSNEVEDMEGLPTVGGALDVPETLRADTSAVMDGNGLPDAADFAYRWRRADADGSNEEDIAGATEATYTTTDADMGKRIGVTVTFTDRGGHDEERIGELTDNPVNTRATGSATIGGTAQVDRMLTADPSPIGDADGLPGAGGFDYQWQRLDAAGSNPVDIPGADSRTYLLQEADEGGRVRVVVRFTDGAGRNEERISDPFPANLADPLDVVLATTNEASGGSPTIGGMARVGEILTATTGGITDGNGLTGAMAGDAGYAFEYQWRRADADGSNEADIAGATDAAYTLTDDDGNKRIRVEVVFTDDEDYPERSTSDATDVVDAPPTGLPAVGGTAQVGETLTAVTSGIGDVNGLTGVSFEYQWRRADADGSNEADIAGATGAAYTLTGDDGNKRVTVRVAFDDDAGYEHVLDSAPMAVVDTPAEGRPAIEGTARVGETLTATTGGIMDGNGLTRARAGDVGYAFEYQWRRADADGSNEADIAGATDAAYTLTADDGNKRIRVEVGFTDDEDYPEESTSVATAVVDAPPTGLPAVGGTARVGETLTAVTSGIGDVNGLTGVSFEYRWRRADADGSNEADIAGATEAAYTLTADDGNKRVTVRVAFDDDAGYEHVLDSAPMAAVDAPAEGRPTIEGTARVDETLTAMTGGITDLNGLTVTEATFAYQWQWADADGSNEADIAGAQSQTYLLVRDDQGKRIRVKVSFMDDDGNPSEELASDPTNPVARELNVAAAGLEIFGDVEVGGTLTTNPLAIVDPQGRPDDVDEYAYLWQRLDPGRDPVDLGTEAAYVLEPGDHQDGNSRIRLTVRFVDGIGYEESPTFTTTDPVAASEPNEVPKVRGVPIPEGRLVLSATTAEGAPVAFDAVEEGHTLTVGISDITDDNDLPDPSTFNYRWERLGADGTGTPVTIQEGEGPAAAAYTLTAADAGGTVRVVVSYRDLAGWNENVESALTGTVQALATVHRIRIEKWMGLFGRAVSDQVLDAVGGRLLSAPPQAQRGEMNLAGRQVRWTPGHEDDAFARNAVEAWFGSGDPRDWLEVRNLKDEAALLGSSFSLTHGTARGGYASVWGRGAWTSFASREGAVELEGEVATGQLGADWSSGPWMAGLSVGHSAGEGDYWDEKEGGIESTLTGVYPYARYDLTERSSVWAVAGYGEGDLKVVPRDGSYEPVVETGLALTMGAAGMRTEMVTAAEAGGGVSLALKADASVVRMDSEAAGALAALQSHANRVRLGLEAAGSRTALAHGATLAPVVDLGVLYEGGDAGSGRGMDTGVGLAYSHPARGLSADFRGRSLFAHSGSGRRDWGVSAGMRYDSDPSGRRGLSVSLDGGYGGRADTGGPDAVFGLRTVEEMGTEGGDATLPGGRLGVELGYGLRAFEGRYTGTPKASLGLTEAGSTWGLGWWFTPSAHGAPDLSGGIELEGREEEGRRIGLRLAAGF